MRLTRKVPPVRVGVRGTQRRTPGTSARGRDAMYIGLGTVVLIILIVLLFMAFGRRT